MSDRRNAYIILGLDFGASAAAAATAFARTSRRIRGLANPVFDLQDASWALHQVEYAETDSAAKIDVYRVPGDQRAYDLELREESLGQDPIVRSRSTAANTEADSAWRADLQRRAKAEARAELSHRVDDAVAAGLSAATVGSAETLGVRPHQTPDRPPVAIPVARPARTPLPPPPPPPVGRRHTPDLPFARSSAGRMSMPEKLVVGSGLLLFLASFFPWFELSYFPGSFTMTGWDVGFFWAGVPALLGLAAAGGVLAETYTDTSLPELPVSWGRAVELAGMLSAALVCFKLLIGESFLERASGLVLASIAAVGFAIGGRLKHQEEQGGLG